MSTFLALNHVLVASQENRTLHLPISLHGIKQTVDTSTLIDSRATGNFINPCLLPKENFKLTPCLSSIIAYNVDGTPNTKGTIHWTSVISFSSGPFSDTVKFMVIRLSCPQIILEMPWLQKWNPIIDWNTFSIDFSPKVKRSLHEYPPLEENINKVTISTELAQAEKPKKISLPNFCSNFADVFAESTHNQLPPHQPFDHTIDLKDTFVPKIAKVHPLNPKEKETCTTFIEEHLKTGCIIPSKSLQASPFLFVPKKDGSLHPCQDYHYLNSHTICNAYPLPLISKLVDNMKDSTYFTKFNIRWGYNNIQIQEKD